MSSNAKIDNASTFTPVHPFDMNDPKSWARTIGMMHWDDEKIVFSKRSLLEFLKSVDVTVNTNFSEIQKLPKYATFGKFSEAATDAAVADLVEAEINDPSHDNEVDPSRSTVPRPSRKVREPPGGKQTLRIFPEELEEEDALSLAPPRDGGSGVDVEVERMERMRLHVEPEEDLGAKIEDDVDAASGNDNSKTKAQSAAAPPARESNPPPNFRPTRNVRQAPGGNSSMGAALFGGYEDETDADREAAIAKTGGRKASQQSGGSGLW